MKRTLLSMGGNWCPWCLRFADFISKDADIMKVITENFIYAHINYNPTKSKGADQAEAAEALMNRLGNPQRFGFPVFVVLDQNGKVLHIQDSSFLEEGKGVIETKYSFRDITWEEEKLCFKGAVLNIMERKKCDGNYLFEKTTQWKAVYRFAVDCGIMYDVEDPKEPQDKSTPQYAVFETFAKELQLDVNPPTRQPFTKSAINDITKEYYIRYNTPYPWSHDGITDARSLKLYTELDDIYLALQEEYTKYLGLAERSL